MAGRDKYDPRTLAAAAARSHTWNDLMRRLGLTPSGGQRRVLQQRIVAHGIDTGHFKQRSPWVRYPDAAIAEAAASSTTLREVAVKLGATPATGTLAHIRRRIAAAGIDVSHFPGIDRPQPDLPFTDDELRAAAAGTDSVRAAARWLGVPDDSRSRAVLGRMFREREIDTTHFRNARLAIPEDALRTAVPEATSYADVLRALRLEVNDTNHRRVRRKVAELGLDTGHFVRRPWGAVRTRRREPVAERVLVVLPAGSARPNRARLHAALQEAGVPCRCASCGNPGQWLGQPITLQIDHINGDWLDNRLENLRYLCPNCHALTATWCRRKAGRHTGDTRSPLD
ncbi:HNH endonuclease [Streptomyces sp. SID2888]|uniref:HNH endonuclease signature motif containing protein n=1 Tax=Streptomyces sp. SID2888 TaxID=2690256 RepID=UPI00136896E1|nr:HNH endonuclease [Streptomyces sp. SID2888]MYV50723.1 HNH endonuclease [Streptomyces sp. SID2888]